MKNPDVGIYLLHIADACCTRMISPEQVIATIKKIPTFRPAEEKKAEEKKAEKK